MAPKCEHYLIPRIKNFQHHLHIWENYLPRAFHEIVVKNYTKETNQIFEMFLKKNQGFNYNMYQVTKPEILEYIEKIKLYFFAQSH